MSSLTFKELNSLFEANVLTVVATRRGSQVTDMYHLIDDDKYDGLITMTMINVK